MKKVFKINCENRAGFVQEFKVKWHGGESGWSDRYPNPQTKSIDLRTLNIPEGAEVWIEVNAILGKKKTADEHVVYDPNSDDAALYETTGATLTYKIKLIN
ncbi:hypothetical protein prwr041_16570 [Prevotella herbatica]|uniref:Uncharacterized protein n=1 Tax=Prevotella herbatica TaxID=2801997 RepID=A0ABM7NZC1_9BACT|nr:hypothetical protein [Prevotella herbatica]BCS85764.1 hypothetical protein prwr041_16570 [Prevotella herbatica]